MKLLVFLIASIIPALLAAQTRYFDPVFPEVKVTANVTYGVNATVLYLNSPLIGQAIPQQIKMDVYEPKGDTASARPLIILLHSGNFLPPQVNGGCNGAVLDGEIVELAKRLAKRGFVVAAADYRLGWFPTSNSETERIYSLVNALHRGVQDSRTCVRYFRKDRAGANQFRIDPEKTTLWGNGVGGMVTLASATLDSMSDWIKPKFLFTGGPFVKEPVNGNLDATTYGVVPPGDPFPVPGDTLCYPNHLGYSSDFKLAVNMVGVLLDTSWLQAGNIPILSFSVPGLISFPLYFEPCGIGDVGYYLPLGVSVVIPDVAGSCAVQSLQAALGNHQAWQNSGFNDPLTAHALDINGGLEGFYPFIGTQEYAPWSFASSLSPYGVSGAMCDTGFISASAYLDTLLAYFAPRACVALGLVADCNQTLAAKEPTYKAASVKISPNPALEAIRITADAPMISIEMYDLQGRLVLQKEGLHDLEAQLQRSSLPCGMYCLRVNFETASSMVKVVWQ